MFNDKLKEECGIVGVFNVSNASYLAYLALHALQHRGQEAAGISTNNNGSISTYKNLGLVADVFNKGNFDFESVLDGDIAIGHVRYSTAGPKLDYKQPLLKEEIEKNSQPILANYYEENKLSIVQNGNLTNVEELKEELELEFFTNMDTELFLHLIAKSKKTNYIDKVKEAMRMVEGSYCTIFLNDNYMCVARDHRGFRPLSLAKLGDGYVVASETCAFDLMGATYIRDIKPGELLIFDIKKKTFESIQVLETKANFCVFEYVYFSRADSMVFGKNVYNIREYMGEAVALEDKKNAKNKGLSIEEFFKEGLSKEASHKADIIVVPVPNSAIHSAIGYAKSSGMNIKFALEKSAYVGRSFIEPNNRDLKVKLKLNPIKSMVKGNIIVLVDDSIVRGTTSSIIIKMLKDAGALAVHMRISSPAIKSPCNYGVDTPNKKDLLADLMDKDGICKSINAQSLEYLSISNLSKIVEDSKNFCMDCFKSS